MATNYINQISPETTVFDTGKYSPAPKEVPVLPLRDTVLYPHAVLPLTIGRESSVQMIQSLGEEKVIAVAAQRDSSQDNPQPSELYEVGTLAIVHKIIRMPNQSLFIFAEGLRRVLLGPFIQQQPFLKAEIAPLDETAPETTPEAETLQRSVVAIFREVVAASPNLSDELQAMIQAIEEPGRIADFVAGALSSLSTVQRQELLETLD